MQVLPLLSLQKNAFNELFEVVRNPPVLALPRNEFSTRETLTHQIAIRESQVSRNRRKKERNDNPSGSGHIASVMQKQAAAHQRRNYQR